MIEIQNPKQNRFGHLGFKFGIYLGFVICNLEFQMDLFSLADKGLRTHFRIHS